MFVIYILSSVDASAWLLLIKKRWGHRRAPPDRHESCIHRWIFSHGLTDLYHYILLFAISWHTTFGLLKLIIKKINHRRRNCMPDNPNWVCRNNSRVR